MKTETQENNMRTNSAPLKLKDAFKGKFQIGTVLSNAAIQGQDPRAIRFIPLCAIRDEKYFGLLSDPVMLFLSSSLCLEPDG